MRPALAVIAVAALALSACAPTAGPVPEKEQKDAANSVPDAKSMIAIVESPQNGWYLMNGDGLTMYRFDDDEPKLRRSSCNGECAVRWRPVPADVLPMTAGVDPLVLGTLIRSDRTRQLTIGGFPQYTFAEDKAPGDMKGQGSGGKWFATGPTGQKASPAAGMPGVPGKSE
ncbi:hypothetical protein [Lentzea albidocapillata]|uniref:Predicted lipoprotein with conserved Yx(FWY)xxD motif n=1 Tax=Lentzea albidocapillata TaxID=40571 RepID=A0A1W2CS96_9PSEU|nr:hypothetical protein [Lentzea albidocapillata]SMC88081.1 Predicted lipoprotein with conserved Yx(FWY)xxD motif [Lentzea albidocapillata]